MGPEDRDRLTEKGWEALPATYRMPDRPPSLSEAKAWCKALAESHYENFHVATWFLPTVLRPHFYSIYAYCRVSDDLGDEVGDPDAALVLLDEWNSELDACYEGRVRHPVFVALAETIRECGIPKQPFADLLRAFRQDQTTTRYPTMLDLMGYCRYSANPVGRLVLYACGEASEEKFRYSDATCTGLQLANFWQDVSIDWLKGRVYIPQQDMEFFGVSEAHIAAGVATEEFRQLIKFEVEFARGRFEEGLALIGMVNPELAIDLDLFSRGGLEILNAIGQQDYDVLTARPAISRSRKFKLGLRAVAGKVLPFLRRNSRPQSGAAH